MVDEANYPPMRHCMWMKITYAVQAATTSWAKDKMNADSSLVLRDMIIKL